MKLKSLDFFYSHFAEEQMNLLYTGVFSDDLTERLIELNDYQYISTDEFKTVQRRSAFLIAECFQNIVRHRDISNQDSYFHIKNAKGQFSLISGNTIQNDIAPSLKGQLEQLNSLTSSELREVYLKTLSEGSFSDLGGAGLGLIEMARKTKNKLNFSFSEIDEIRSYFYFQLLLNSSNESQNSYDTNFDNNIFLREVMVKEDLFLVYKGNISTQVTSAILGILEQTFDSVNQKVYFIKWMSFLEKISSLSSSAGHDNSIMLLIGENDFEYNMGTTCYLSNIQALSIQRALKLYRTFSLKMLHSEQERLLKEGNSNAQNEYFLFLVDLLKGSLHVDLDIKSYSEKLSVVSFAIEFQKKAKSKIIFAKEKQVKSDVKLQSIK